MRVFRPPRDKTKPSTAWREKLSKRWVVRGSRPHGVTQLTVQSHCEHGAVFFRCRGIVGAAGLGETIESRAVAGRNDVVFRKSARGRPVEGDHPFVTQIRQPQAKERAVVVVAAAGGGAIK